MIGRLLPVWFSRFRSRTTEPTPVAVDAIFVLEPLISGAHELTPLFEASPRFSPLIEAALELN